MTELPERTSGELLASPPWLAARIADSARRWSCADTRVATTLWWYTASSTLFRGLLGPWASTGALRHPGLEHLTFRLAADGSLGEVGSSWDCADLDELGAAWRTTLRAVLEPLARASGTRVRPLWAIASDSLANRALDAGSVTLATDLAVRIGPELPPPRYVQVAGRVLPRRSSCCLIYQVNGKDKCTSCPRRSPAERNALLAGLQSA